MSDKREPTMEGAIQQLLDNALLGCQCADDYICQCCKAINAVKYHLILHKANTKRVWVARDDANFLWFFVSKPKKLIAAGCTYWEGVEAREIDLSNWGIKIKNGQCKPIDITITEVQE